MTNDQTSEDKCQLVDNEPPEQRRNRYRELTEHLGCKCKGLQDVPDCLLLALSGSEITSPVRPGIPLVAHYGKVTHKSLGKATARESLSLFIGIFAFLLLIMGATEKIPLIDLNPWFQPVSKEVNQQLFKVMTAPSWTTWHSGALLVAIQLAAITIFWSPLAVGVLILTWPLKNRRGPLHLNLHELSISLPDGSRHSKWCDVHSATPKKGHIHVELNDGVAAKLKVPKDDCQPLADLMQKLILYHRRDCRPVAGDPELQREPSQ